ncbi:MAG: hypothetical protein WBG42_02510 [Cryomorphaceae bacterium]
MRIAAKIFLFFMLIAAASCGEYEADIIDPRLPAYTESGTGDGGAYIDDKVWRNADIPSSFSSSGSPGMRWRAALNPTDSTELTRVSFLNGFVENQKVEIIFYLFDYRISNKSELLQLIERRIDLNGNPDYAEILFYQNESVDTLKSTKGAIYFRHIEYQVERERTVVSGTFGFEAENDSASSTVQSGRYDFGVGDFEFRSF